MLLAIERLSRSEMSLRPSFVVGFSLKVIVMFFVSDTCYPLWLCLYRITSKSQPIKRKPKVNY